MLVQFVAECVEVLGVSAEKLEERISPVEAQDRERPVPLVIDRVGLPALLEWLPVEAQVRSRVVAGRVNQRGGLGCERAVEDWQGVAAGTQREVDVLGRVAGDAPEQQVVPAPAEPKIAQRIVVSVLLAARMDALAGGSSRRAGPQPGQQRLAPCLGR